MTAGAAVVGLLLATLVGFGSALLPLVNAEAYAVVAARSAPALVVALALALAAGQTAGKLVLFESARRGSERWKVRDESSRRARWEARVTPWMRSSRTGAPLVLVAAALGIPPLAVVALVAGASGQRRWLFAGLVLAGRGARFAAIVVPVSHLVG